MVAAKLVSSSTRSMAVFGAKFQAQCRVRLELYQSVSIIRIIRTIGRNATRQTNLSALDVSRAAPVQTCFLSRSRPAFPSQKDGLEKLKSRESEQRGCIAAVLGDSPSIRRTPCSARSGRHCRQFARFLLKTGGGSDLASGLSSGWDEISFLYRSLYARQPLPA